VVAKLDPLLFTGLPFDEAIRLQWIVLARGADIIDDQVDLIRDRDPLYTTKFENVLEHLRGLLKSYHRRAA
jgi:hypothetical protein